MENPTRNLHFLCIHTRLKARVYTKKIQVAREVFHGTRLQSIVKLVYNALVPLGMLAD